MHKFTIGANDKQKQWLDTLSHRHNMSIREFCRRLLDSAIAANWDPSQELAIPKPSVREKVGEKAKDMDPRELFLLCLREHYGVGLAAEEAGVTRETVEEWANGDKDFLKKVIRARDLCLEEAAKSLRDLGEGQISGNSQALTKFLEANHPDYAPVAKRRAFDQIMGELVDSIATNAMIEFEKLEGGPKAVKRFVTRVLEDTQYYRSTIPE